MYTNQTQYKKNTALATFEPFISKSIRSNQFEKHRQEISKGREGKKLCIL